MTNKKQIVKKPKKVVVKKTVPKKTIRQAPKKTVTKKTVVKKKPMATRNPKPKAAKKK